MSARASLVDVFPLECRGNVKDPIHFNITFEVYEDLPEGKRLISDWGGYLCHLEFGFEVVMAWDGQHEHDQVLDSIEVGPVKTGKHNFILDVNRLLRIYCCVCCLDCERPRLHQSKVGGCH